MNRKHIRYQRFDRLRKPANRFIDFLELESDRLGAPARVLRDRIRQLGTLDGFELRTAADAEAAGIVLSTAAEVDLTAYAADTDDAPFFVGASTLSGMSLGQDAGTNLKLGATTGAIALVFVDGGGSADSITRAAGSFLTDGFRAGCSFAATGNDEVGNAGPFTALTVSALAITVATGSLTADAADTATLTSLDVVSGGSCGSLIADAFLTIAAGPAADDYTIDTVGADFVILAEALDAVDADYDEGAYVLNVITRATGSFLTDGFFDTDPILVSGATNEDLDIAVATSEIRALAILLQDPFDAVEAASTARIDCFELRRSAGSFTTDGFLSGQQIYADGRLIGVADVVDPTRISFDEDFAASEITQAGTVTSDPALIRASGSFLTDGFLAGDRVYLGGTAGSDGVYTLATAAALVVTLQETVPEAEADVEAVLYLLSGTARENPQA